MTATSLTGALARVTSALIDSHDVTTTLQMLVLGCAEALGDSPTGLLTLGADGQLELMAASSHVAAELELYHSQADEGPALDAIRSGQVLLALDRQSVADNWPFLVDVMGAAGVTSIIAAPLRWHGRNFGALNVFRLDEGELAAETILGVQGLADIAALCIVYSHVQPQHAEMAEALQRTLDGRTLIEHAKGAVAAQDGISLAASFASLVAAAEERGISLPAMASRAIGHAEQGRHWRG